jgi:hypothetical protein
VAAAAGLFMAGGALGLWFGLTGWARHRSPDPVTAAHDAQAG